MQQHQFDVRKYQQSKVGITLSCSVLIKLFAAQSSRVPAVRALY
jgi:hypothetical protein